MSARNYSDVNVLSDVFPSEKSGFSYSEISNILRHWHNSRAYCFEGAFNFIEEGRTSIRDEIEKFNKKNKDLQNKVYLAREKSSGIEKTKILYSIFLKDTYRFVLPLANKYDIPFVFTLYPGGQFELEDSESDRKLKEIFSSPNFRRVIVTQKITKDYLMKKKLCRKENIEYIFGVVTPEAKNTPHGKRFGDKRNLDIVFAAHKYSDAISDKGFDIFCEVAKKLSKKYSNINFHIIGNHTDCDYDISGIKNIKFYGSVDNNSLRKIYRNIDIIISPTFRSNGEPRSFFDGFPVASATDAAACGVAMFVTDPLGLNDGHFIDKVEMEIIEHDVEYIVSRVEYYYNNPLELTRLAEKGKEKVNRIYSYDSQMKPRINVLDKCIQGKYSHMKPYLTPKTVTVSMLKTLRLFNPVALAKRKIRIRTRVKAFLKG